MLQKMLDKGNIIAVILINLRGVPLAETVSADLLVARMVADDGELLLYGPLRERENAFRGSNAPQFVDFFGKLPYNILVIQINGK